MPHIIIILLTLIVSAFSLSTHNKEISFTSQRILDRAQADRIDLLALNITPSALASIEELHHLTPNTNTTISIPSNTTPITSRKIDTHVHPIPPFYRLLVPTTGGQVTPPWNLSAHLEFMQSLGIEHSVLSISSPGSGVFPEGEDGVEGKVWSVGLARLLNEWMSELVRKLPEKFSFLGVVPLPYVEESIIEAKYAFEELGAVGLGLLSNHQGYYLGNATLAPFFHAINDMRTESITLFVHPTDPVVSCGGHLISANPTEYTQGLVEYYFETARTLMSLILSPSPILLNLTNIKWHIPHLGGSFPSILDRFLVRQPSDIGRVYEVMRTRMWWDSAGPTFPNQVMGLLGYGVGREKIVFGTDYPYGFNADIALARLVNSTFLTEEELEGIFVANAQKLYPLLNK